MQRLSSVFLFVIRETIVRAKNFAYFLSLEKHILISLFCFYNMSLLVKFLLPGYLLNSFFPFKTTFILSINNNTIYSYKKLILPACRLQKVTEL